MEIFLPIADNAGRAFPRHLYDEQKAKLAEAYGGLTAFTRAPAEGIWGQDKTRDDIVIFEVMTASLDKAWWQSYRQTLQGLFRQDQILIRATQSDRL
ncbi:MAG: hypothetical protein NVV72_10250 [Asticcacaulis sp.]|nr:hypothetical protein [Asticcacaulis sp.]